MTANTYGELQDATASALTQLLAGAEIPVQQDQLDTVIACQGILRDTLADRLVDLGVRGLPSRLNSRLPPLVKLATLIEQLPKRDGFAEGALTPTEVLRTPDPDTSQWAANWQQAASSAMQATAALQCDTERQSWEDRPESVWHLAGDIANTLEAAAVLDQDLVATGRLPGRIPDPDSLDTLRQTTSYISQMGTWYGTDATADLATRDTGNTGHTWQVHLIRGTGDLDLAQRRLGDFLPVKKRSLQSEPRLTRTEALAAITTQRRLTGELAHASQKLLGAHDGTTQSLALLHRDLGSVLMHLSHLHDVTPAKPRLNVMGQLTELNVGIRRLSTRGELANISPVQLAALAQTSRWTCSRFAQELTTEARIRHGNLRYVQHGSVTPVWPDQPLGKALNLLTNGGPTLPARDAWFPKPDGPRIQLRRRLDATPTSRTRARPSPLRGSDYGR